MKTPTQNNSLKKIRWFTWLRITGIIIFVIILFRVNLSEIWENILKIQPGFLLLGILSQIFLLLIKGLRWNLLNRRINGDSNLFQSMGEFLESYAIGVITPGRLGELMKAGYQKDRAGVFASGLRVIAERGFDVGIFTIIAGFALLFEGLVVFPKPIAWLIVASGVLIFVIATILISNAGTGRFLNRIFKKFLLDYYHHDIKTTFSIIILTVFSNAFAFLSIYFLSTGIALQISFLGLSGGVAIAGLFNMLPVTVMGLGTRELTFLYIFSAFPRAEVLALSGLVFFVAQIGGGLIAMVLGQFFLFLKKMRGSDL